MTALSDYFIARASGRRILLILALVGLCLVAFNLILTPTYQAVSAGFVPFDLQFPLSRESIVIQFGAMSEASLRAYINFALIDFIFPPLGAAFLVLFWAWLVQKGGSPILIGFYRRGWWVWAIFPCLCDWAENVTFLSLFLARPAIDPDMLELAVDVHRAKFVFLAIAQSVTVALVLTTGLQRLFKKKIKS